jgi:hypothetical protein
MEVTPDQWQRWLDDLKSKLSVDEDFRRAFQATPGKAVSTLGVPNELIGPLISQANHDVAASTPPDRPGEKAGERSERRWADLDDDGTTG